MHRATESGMQQSSTLLAEKSTWQALWENLVHFLAILLGLLISLVNSLITVQEVPEINVKQFSPNQSHSQEKQNLEKSLRFEDTSFPYEEEHDDASVSVPSAGKEFQDFELEREKKLGRSKVITLKNLPWDLKKEELIKVLSTLEAKPADVYYLNNSSGKFTGMASIKYPSPDHANIALPALNSLMLGGRPVHAEFRNRKRDKKKKQEKEKEIHASSPKITARRRSSISYPNSALRHTSLDQSQEEVVLTPGGTRRRSFSVSLLRQPIGPDGTKGFSSDYQRQRNQNLKMRRFTVA